jgi:hypothetical protein
MWFWFVEWGWLYAHDCHEHCADGPADRALEGLGQHPESSVLLP